MKRALLAVAGLLTLSGASLADRLITRDGRVLEVKKARLLSDGSYRLVFEGGEILCAAEHVASVEIEGDMSDYVPANADEASKLEKGYVRFRGKWLSKAAYKAELGKESVRSRARTAELAAHSKFHDGWEKKTKHFAIKSNTSPELLDYYAELLEAYYDLMNKRVGINPSPSLKRTKMKVRIYKSRPEFTAITRVAPNVAGFFNYVQGELHFYHDYQDPSISNWVSLHEGTHLLTFLIEPQAQPQIWINEGVADYFGSARITTDKRGKLKIEPGQLSLERVLTVQQAMAEGTHIPLEKLFMIPRDQFHSFEYAHAWSFVYFLNNAGKKYERGFKKFFKAFYTIAKGVEFDLEVGGGNKYGSWKRVPPAEVRRLLLDKLKVKDVVRLEEEWMTFTTEIVIDAPQALLKRGLQALRLEHTPENLEAGLDDLNKAIEAGIEDPRVFWARAALRLAAEHDAEAALQDIRQAVELAPLNATYRANLGQILAGTKLRMGGLKLALSPEGKLSGDDEALAEAENQFTLACELEPENETLREARDDFHALLAEHTTSR